MSACDRMRRRTGLALLGAALVAAPVAAQSSGSIERTPQGAVVRTVPPDGFARIQTLTSRPSLGLVVDMRAGASDSIGARIESVTPAGRAARARTHPADSITRFAGRCLRAYPRSAAAPRNERNEPRSAPAMRLIIQSVQLEPNDTVALQLRRGGSLRNVRVVTEPHRTVTYWRQPATGASGQVGAELEQRYDLELRSREPMMASTGNEHSRILFDISPLGNPQ